MSKLCVKVLNEIFVCLKLANKLSIVPTEDIMEILQITRNGKMVNTPYL